MGLLSTKFGVKTTAYFCRMMAQGLQGGVRIDRALGLLMGPGAPASLRRALPPVIDCIRQGGTLAEAFAAQRRLLPEDVLELLSVAERGGKAEAAFDFLAHDYELRLEFLRSMVRQLTYPFMLWLSSCYIIPYFKGLMTSPEGPEAYSLRFCANVLVSWLPLLTVWLVLRQLGLLEKLVYAVASNTWPWRGILHRIALVRFFRCLAMLLDAGLAVPQAIERSAAVTVNPRVRRALAKAVPMVQRGDDLTAALGATGMLPDLALDMVRTGEYAGRLEELVRKTAQYIEESTAHYVVMVQYSFFALLVPAVVVGFVLRALADLLVAGVIQAWSILAG